jgi:hypothetical protein
MTRTPLDHLITQRSTLSSPGCRLSGCRTRCRLVLFWIKADLTGRTRRHTGAGPAVRPRRLPLTLPAPALADPRRRDIGSGPWAAVFPRVEPPAGALRLRDGARPPTDPGEPSRQPPGRQRWVGRSRAASRGGPSCRPPLPDGRVDGRRDGWRGGRQKIVDGFMRLFGVRRERLVERLPDSG